MESKADCYGCEREFSKHDLFVYKEGIFCSECIPENVTLHVLTFGFSWKEIIALTEYIDGGRDLDTLEIIDDLQGHFQEMILLTLRGALTYGIKIQQSNSKSVDSGDESS